MKKCKYCGEEIQDSAKKCRYCGEWINENNNLGKKEDIKNKYSSKTKLIWGVILSSSLISIFIISIIINWLASLLEFNGSFDTIFGYIIGLLYFISIVFLTPFGIYLLISNKKQIINNENFIDDNEIEYIGFWERVGANLIDTFLAYLIIPLFFNLYYWFKNGQTIGYKVIGAKTFSVDGNKIKSASGVQLFFYPFLKILDVLTLYIGFIMIGFTKKKQGLHNIISNTVVVRIEKKNNNWIIIIVGIFVTITLLAILSTIAFISLEGYKEETERNINAEQQNENISININSWLEVSNSSKLINEEFDKKTLKEINGEAEKGFLTNKGNYILIIPEKLDSETSEIYANEKNNNQTKLNFKSYLLGIGGENVEGKIKKIDGITFYIFNYDSIIDGELYYYYAIFGGKNLDFVNIYLWGDNKENIEKDGEFLINNLKNKNL